jgi:hypothetical protein
MVVNTKLGRRTMILSIEDAERVVEGKLRQLEQAFEPKDLVIDKQHIRECEWGWIIPYESRDGGPLFGTGPFCVARDTGTTEMLTSGGRSFASQVRRFERRIGFRPWWRFW